MKNLKRRCASLTAGLHQHIEDLESKKFAAKRASEFISLLKNLLVEISNEVEVLENKKKVNLCCILLEDLSFFLNFLEKSKTEQAPQALFKMLESMSSDIRPEEILITAPDSDFNYQVIELLPLLQARTEYLFSKEKQKEIYASCQNGINVVLFPRTARDDVLMHAMFGHELGHAIADEYLSLEESNEIESPLPYSEGLEQVSKEINSLTKSEKNDQPSFEDLFEKGMWISDVIEIRKRGLQEVISDCVGTLLLGPSALFALRDFLITEPLDLAPSSPEYYPPARFRLRQVLIVLERSGCLDALYELTLPTDVANSLRDQIDKLKEITGIRINSYNLNFDDITRISYGWLDRSLEQAINYAETFIGENGYSPDSLRNEVPELVDRLFLSIPPNEIGVPPKLKSVDWRSSLIAAWIYQIYCFQGSLPENEEKLCPEEVIDKIQRLTISSINSIHLQNGYSQFTQEN